MLAAEGLEGPGSVTSVEMGGFIRHSWAGVPFETAGIILATTDLLGPTSLTGGAVDTEHLLLAEDLEGPGSVTAAILEGTHLLAPENLEGETSTTATSSTSPSAERR